MQHLDAPVLESTDTLLPLAAIKPRVIHFQVTAHAQGIAQSNVKKLHPQSPTMPIDRSLYMRTQWYTEHEVKLNVMRRLLAFQKNSEVGKRTE